MGNSVLELEQYSQSPVYRELQTNSDLLVARAEQLTVNTVDDFSIATGFTQDIRKVRQRISDFFKPLKETAFKLHRDITSREKSIDGPYLNAEQIIRRKMEVYVAEQKRIQEEEAARLRKAQEDSIITMAANAEKVGDVVGANLLLATPITTAKAEIPMPEKTSTRQDLVVEVTDVKKLAEEVAAGRINPSVFSVNESVIKAYAKANGIDKANQLKGVRCSYKSTIVFRR